MGLTGDYTGALWNVQRCESDSSAILPSGSEHGSPILQGNVLFTGVVMLVPRSLRISFVEIRP